MASQTFMVYIYLFAIESGLPRNCRGANFPLSLSLSYLLTFFSLSLSLIFPSFPFYFLLTFSSYLFFVFHFSSFHSYSFSVHSLLSSLLLFLSAFRLFFFYLFLVFFFCIAHHCLSLLPLFLSFCFFIIQFLTFNISFLYHFLLGTTNSMISLPSSTFFFLSIPPSLLFSSLSLLILIIK